MIFTFQSVQDSIVVSTPGFHLRGLGLIPRVEVERMSKNWTFLFISKDKWFVKAAHSSESWDLCLKFFKNLELSLDSRSEREFPALSWNWLQLRASSFLRFPLWAGTSCSEPESRLKSKSLNIVRTQQKLCFQHRAQNPGPYKGNRVSSIEKLHIIFHYQSGRKFDTSLKKFDAS